MILTNEIDSYVDEIKLSMKRISSVFHTLSNLSINSVRVGMSGGFDSRVILAALLNSTNASKNAIFNCTNKSDHNNLDYQVVTELSQAFSFPLGLRDKTVLKSVKGKSVNPVKLWILSNAGTYDSLYTANYSTKQGPIFQSGGFGAEAYKGMYGWRPLKRIANHIKDQEAAEAFRTQTEKGISLLGIDKNESTGSEWHYLGYRNALHAGRSTMTSMFGLRPLMQHRLVALSRSNKNPLQAKDNKNLNMLSDMLIYAHPELAKFRFDKPEKNLDHIYVDERSKFLGSLTQNDLDEYAIHGEVKYVNHGSPDVFHNLIDDMVEDKFSVSYLLEKLQNGMDILPQNCKTSYLLGYEEAKLALTNKDVNINTLRSYPGKLMGIGLIL